MSSQYSGWTVVRLPALAEDDEMYEFTTAFGPDRLCRKEGEPLNPERTSIANLAQIRAEIGEYNFAAQYQQRPVPMEGALVRPEWLQRFKLSEFQPGQGNVYQAWDTAMKAGELNDFSVCVTFVERNHHYFLIDVLRRRLEYPALRDAAIAQYERFRPEYVLIEDRASGTQLIQELEAAGLYNVKGITPLSSVDKIMRFRAETALFSAGRVHVPIEAAWLADYLDEIFAFPGSKYDDQVDATAHALAFMRSESDTRSMWERLAD